MGWPIFVLVAEPPAKQGGTAGRMKVLLNISINRRYDP